MEIVSICIKFQILFSGENMKYVINLSSAELAQRVVKVKEYIFDFSGACKVKSHFMREINK